MSKCDYETFWDKVFGVLQFCQTIIHRQWEIRPLSMSQFVHYWQQRGFLVWVMVYVRICVMLLDISLTPTGGFTHCCGPRQYKLAWIETSLYKQETSTWTKLDLLTPPIPALHSSVNQSEIFKIFKTVLMTGFVYNDKEIPCETSTDSYWKTRDL